MAEQRKDYAKEREQRNERTGEDPQSGHPGVMIEVHHGHEEGTEEAARENGGERVHADGKPLIDARISNKHQSPI